MRAALGWSQQNAIEKALRLAAALRQYLKVRNRLSEGRGMALPAVGQPAAGAPPRLRARALHEAGWWADYQGDLEAGAGAVRAGIGHRAHEDDQKAIASILLAWGEIAYNRGDYDRYCLLGVRGTAQRIGKHPRKRACAKRDGSDRLSPGRRRPGAGALRREPIARASGRGDEHRPHPGNWVTWRSPSGITPRRRPSMREKLAITG